MTALYKKLVFAFLKPVRPFINFYPFLPFGKVPSCLLSLSKSRKIC
uniref:Uncharacterized protein n=1 Tax=Rhizophora mucronata TaxID=61149 RepID=A0A2P2IN86_RHIMU